VGVTQDTVPADELAMRLFDDRADIWFAKYAGPLRGRLAVFGNAVSHHVAPGGSILDVGCGPGMIALALAQSGFRVTGIDIAPEMIAVARRAAESRNVSIDFQVGDVTSLGAMEQRYAAVVCSSVFEYLPDPAAALSGFRHVLNPGGFLILTIPNSRSWQRRLERLARYCCRGLQWCRRPQRLDRYRQYLLLSRNRYSPAAFTALTGRFDLAVTSCLHVRRENPNASPWRAWTSSLLLFVLTKRAPLGDDSAAKDRVDSP